MNEFAVGPLIPLQEQFVMPRGSAGRTASLFDLSLRGSYDTRVRTFPGVRFVVDVMHIGNPQEVTQLDELHYGTNVGGSYSSPNKNYLRPIAYQPPMEVRLGIEVGYR